MKVALFYNQSEKSKKVAQDFMQLWCEGEFERDDENPDVIITIGGDGTLLAAVHHYKAILDKVRFAAIHTGHLGFYTDWRDYEAKELIRSLRNDQGERASYPLLEVTLTRQNGHVSHHIALNEATLRKVNGTLVCEVFINGKLFENFRGDGICVATPTGSTGINKSLGGAIVNPRARVMQMTEMASINNRVYRTVSSPMIFAYDEVLTLRPHSEEGMVMSMDHVTYGADDIKEIQLKMSQTEVSFVQYRHTEFWDRVEVSFIGARDVEQSTEKEGNA